MDHLDQKPFHFESEKVDRLVELAVEEVLKDQDLYHQYLERPYIWIHDVLPEILININKNEKLIPHENLETKDLLTLTWARDTFKGIIQDRVERTRIASKKDKGELMATVISLEDEKKKVALVLSGGGAKGAFEMAAEKYAREVKGYQWDIIAGVSVGSLNAVMLAMKKYDHLEEIWTTISNDQVFTGDYQIPNFIKLGFTTIMSWIGLAKPVKSVLGNQPLRRKIEQEVFLKDIAPDIRLTIGVVSLSTGKYIAFTPEMAAKNDQTFRKAVIASTSIPIAWPPVDISSEYKELVDGGVRNITPLGDVIDAGAKEIVIINCNSADPPVVTKSFRDIFTIGFRSIEIITDEVFKTDLNEFLGIDRLVQEAKFQNVELHNEHGKPLDYFDCKIIQPQEPLADTLNFSQKAVRESMKKGLEQAQKILGPPANPEQTQRLETIKARWKLPPARL